MKRGKLACAIFCVLGVFFTTFYGCSSGQNQPGGGAAPGTQNSQGETTKTLPQTTVTTISAESEKLYEQGMEFYNKFQYKDAIVYFDKAISKDAGNYKAYSSKGVALSFGGSYQQGVAMINKALEIKPDYYPAFYDMAMAYKLQKKYDESLYWFQKNIQSDPENTWSYYGISTIYADRSDYENSLTYLKKAIDLDSSVKEVAATQDHFAKMRSLPQFKALVGS